MKSIYYYNYQICKLGIVEEDGYITRILFEKLEDDSYIVNESPLIKEANFQLQDYFNGKLKEFDLPLLIRGTDFEKKVYKALLNIPYGQTRSYKDIAEEIGHPKAYRAVGSTNNKNPLPVIVPCHRVIGSKGNLVGYAGGIKLKNQLLELEKIIVVY